VTNGWLRINLRPIDIANLVLLAACWHYVLTIMPFSCMLCRREKKAKKLQPPPSCDALLRLWLDNTVRLLVGKNQLAGSANWSHMCRQGFMHVCISAVQGNVI